MQMRKLEDIVGKPIFQKNGRLVCLTTAGEALIPYARRIIHLLDRALDQVAGERFDEEISFGVAEDYVTALLPLILRVFAENRPNTAVNVKTGSSLQLYEMTQSEEIELALVTRRAIWKDVEVVRRERLVWTGAICTLPRDKTPIPVAMFREGCIRRDLIMDALVHNRDSFRIVCTSESLSGLIAAARTGVGFAPMARCCVPDDLHIFSGVDGLPELPMIELGLVKRPNATVSLDMLASCIMTAIAAQ